MCHKFKTARTARSHVRPKLKNKTYVKRKCGEAKEFYDHKRILKTKFDSYDWLLIFLADKKTHKFLLLLLTLE